MLITTTTTITTITTTSLSVAHPPNLESKLVLSSPLCSNPSRSIWAEHSRRMVCGAFWAKNSTSDDSNFAYIFNKTPRPLFFTRHRDKNFSLLQFYTVYMAPYTSGLKIITYDNIICFCLRTSEMYVKLNIT